MEYYADGTMEVFTYDCRNRLVSAGSTAYTYDAENNRIGVTTETSASSYVEENNSGSLSQILSATETLLSTKQEKTTRYIYGNGLLAQEDETGLYYMRARYYNVDIKRFINQDVVEGSIAASPSLNKYAYCQGNPVKLTDPFGLSPFTIWSTLGHALLDVLGFIPVIGVIPDTVNGLWYMKEGDYFSAVASFVSAIPGWGDVVGLAGKSTKGCSKMSKMVRYGSKVVGRIGNIALGSYQTGNIAVSVYDKHVVQGESWDWDSTVQLFSAGLFATTTVMSAKGLKGDVGEYRKVLGSKGGRYSEVEIKSIVDNLKGDGFKNNSLRQAYENEVAGLKAYGENLLANGMSEEQVARTLNQTRRDLGIKYKNATPQPLREYIYEINMKRYADRLGPTYERMIKKGKSNADIINSSSRPNSNIDGLLSGFEEWLRRQ